MWFPHRFRIKYRCGNKLESKVDTKMPFKTQFMAKLVKI